MHSQPNDLKTQTDDSRLLRALFVSPGNIKKILSILQFYTGTGTELVNSESRNEHYWEAESMFTLTHAHMMMNLC